MAMGRMSPPFLSSSSLWLWSFARKATLPTCDNSVWEACAPNPGPLLTVPTAHPGGGGGMNQLHSLRTKAPGLPGRCRGCRLHFLELQFGVRKRGPQCWEPALAPAGWGWGAVLNRLLTSSLLNGALCASELSRHSGVA